MTTSFADPAFAPIPALVGEADARSDAALAAIADASRRCFSSVGYAVSVHPNWHARPDVVSKDAYRTWEKVILVGRDYLVGQQVPLDQFVQSHRSPLSAWQKLAFEWARTNPDRELHLKNSRFAWVVRQRGEYVEFSLPHHDAGGEKDYVSRDGRTKVQVNAD